MATGIAKERFISASNILVTPSGVVIKPDGGFYVSSVLNGAIVEYDAAGQAVRPVLERTGPGFPIPTGSPLGLGLTWTDPRLVTATVQARFSGEQFDDDVNEFVLGAYGVVDFQVSRAVTQGLVGFVAVENLFDKDYDTGRTPIRLIGWPRTIRVGMRVALR